MAGLILRPCIGVASRLSAQTSKGRQQGMTCGEAKKGIEDGASTS
jgi:hypothetical protein